MLYPSVIRHRSLLTALTMAMATLLPWSAVRADINLKFGVYTSELPTDMVKAYRPILSSIEKALAEKLNEPVNISLKVASSYKKGMDALVNGSVDFSMFGPASYISAYKQNPGLRILALESRDGSKSFNGVICVQQHSPVLSIEQLHGKSFAFGNERSTLGRYLAQDYLTERGITANDLESFQYLGRHDRVAHAVANGSFDAGALKEGTFNKLVSKGLKLRVLATMPSINRPWVASSEMGQSLYIALQETMLNLSDTKAFKAFRSKMFVEGDDSDFAVIRGAVLYNELFFGRGDTTAPIATNVE